jgi:hypothetical protein
VVLALLLGVASWFVARDLHLGVKVFLWTAFVVACVVAALTIRDLRRLSAPAPRRRAFRWAPWALADFAVCALLLAGANWWLEEQARGPALAQGMWWTTDCCNVDSAYDARLRDTFPVGTTQSHLRDVLVRDGYELEGPHKAVARWWDFACSHFADVEWSANADGRLTSIRGDVGSVCL